MTSHIDVNPLSFVVLALFATGTAQSQSTPPLTGTWRLVSYEGRDSKGQVQYPLGERVTGQLVYDAGGNMSAQIMKDARSAFASNDAVRGTDREVREAFEGYLGYFGTYAIDPAKRTVTHHVQGSSFPNAIGLRARWGSRSQQALGLSILKRRRG